MTRYRDPQDRHGANPVEPLAVNLPAYHGTVLNSLFPETRYLGPRDEQSVRPDWPAFTKLSELPESVSAEKCFPFISTLTIACLRLFGPAAAAHCGRLIS